MSRTGDTAEFWYAGEGPKKSLKGVSASSQVGSVPQHRGEPSSSNQGKRGRRRDEWVEEEEPRNSAKLNLAAYRSIAWPPSKAQEKDPREELARTASDLAAAVAGLACQEGEEEVNVDPDTLKADVVVISEPDWGASDPEIQEALVPMTKLEESLEVKTEARSEPGETLQVLRPLRHLLPPYSDLSPTSARSACRTSWMECRHRNSSGSPALLHGHRVPL